MIYPIVAYGHPMLRLKAKKINQMDKNIVQVIQNMFSTMIQANGIGLAAPQIGKSIQLFIIDSRIFGEKKIFPKVFINPILKPNHTSKISDFEGCLSIPGIQAQVKRFKKITVQYQDIDGIKHESIFKDMPARVIQHEYDHLVGKLYIDDCKQSIWQKHQKILTHIQKGHVHVPYKMLFYKEAQHTSPLER